MSASSTRFGTSSLRSRRSPLDKERPGTSGQSVASPGFIRELLPKKGYLHCEDTLTFVLCKPKLLPLKSYTMENLTRIQQDSIEKAKQEMNATNLD